MRVTDRENLAEGLVNLKAMKPLTRKQARSVATRILDVEAWFAQHPSQWITGDEFLEPGEQYETHVPGPNDNYEGSRWVMHTAKQIKACFIGAATNPKKLGLTLSKPQNAAQASEELMRRAASFCVDINDAASGLGAAREGWREIASGFNAYADGAGWPEAWDAVALRNAKLLQVSEHRQLVKKGLKGFSHATRSTANILASYDSLNY